MPSTKFRLRDMTYAQILCSGVASQRLRTDNRYQTNSESKSLIYIRFLKCFFYGQSGESLDLQGLQRHEGNLSTKLSTEKLNICKDTLNQALSAVFACVGQTMPTISHKLLTA